MHVFGAREAKGIPKHRDERQMGHYFDNSSWQDEMNRKGGKTGRGAKPVLKKRPRAPEGGYAGTL